MKYVDDYNDYTFLPFFETSMHKDYTYEAEMHIPKMRLRILQMASEDPSSSSSSRKPEKESEEKCAVYVVFEKIHLFNHREFLPKNYRYEVSIQNFYIKDLYSPHLHLPYVVQTIFPDKHTAEN